MFLVTVWIIWENYADNDKHRQSAFGKNFNDREVNVNLVKKLDLMKQNNNKNGKHNYTTINIADPYSPKENNTVSEYLRLEIISVVVSSSNVWIWIHKNPDQVKTIEQLEKSGYYLIDIRRKSYEYKESVQKVLLMRTKSTSHHS